MILKKDYRILKIRLFNNYLKVLKLKLKTSIHKKKMISWICIMIFINIKVKKIYNSNKVTYQ